MEQVNVSDIANRALALYIGIFDRAASFLLAKHLTLRQSTVERNQHIPNIGTAGDVVAAETIRQDGANQIGPR